MKYFSASILLLIAACSNAISADNAYTSTGPAETLFMRWDGQEFRLDNGDSFQMHERHLIRDEYPDAKSINLTLVRPGLADSLPDLIAQFKAIGFHNVSSVESAILYRDKQTKSPIDDRPVPLNVYLTDVISISDKNYDYNEMDSFIDQITLFDPRVFTVVLNVRHSSDPNLERIVDEIEDLGFKTVITLNVAQ